MTTGEYSPLLRNGSNRISATQHHLPINANYYDITDIESWPIAGLMVLLDGQAQPVRAELHLYDDLDEHTQEAAIRQARLVLQERYLGGAPVPVRILETLQVREEMLVRLPPVGARPLSVQNLAWRWRPHGMIAAAALAFVVLTLVVSALIGALRDEPELATTAETPASASEGAGQVVADVPTAVGGEVAAETEGVAGTGSVADTPATNANLPVSRNARSDLGIGVQVQVVPGLRIALRSEAGADSGIVVGELGEGIVATIVGGPEYTQGDTDTIVWWLVDLPDGTQAWAAANTSQQTLLMPAQ
jgi:hypothetical protein